MQNGFSYKSTQVSITGGKKLVRNVTIKNGKGYKSIKRFCKGKCNSTMKRRLILKEIKMIQRNEYIPGLFKKCHPKRISHRHKT
jgi:hypothetical protein